MKTRFATSLLVAALALAAAGCGGDDGESEAEREAEGAGRGTITCSGTEVAGETGLPASFPEPLGVTYVKTEERGPTHVVDGFYEGSLEEAYEGYKDAFEDAGYDILFDELEEDDSEVSYATDDDETEGIVALRKACEDDDVISVHITNRPR